LELSALNYLRGKKNLLAFSAGVDSTALFFLLIQNDIEFDIATVNYKLRQQSEEEVEYAKELAKRYGKKIFIKTAPVKGPSLEEKARNIRYGFFEQIIKNEGYDNLITAHQLNDNFEWLLMQLGKGAGAAELVGMEPISYKHGYRVVRPLLFTTKEEILKYLDKNEIRYFTDNSNYDESFFRNYIRHNFSEKFLKEFKEGVKKSFKYLQEDKKLLEKDFEILKLNGLFLAKSPKQRHQLIRIMDRIFKELGYLLSSSQKDEMLSQKTGVVAGRFAFSIKECIMVAPYVEWKLKKEEKELFRKLKIPKTIRPYLAKESIPIDSLQTYIDKVRNCR